MTMKPFPRLFVPRPPPKTSATPELERIEHACRPVDHVKPPPRIVATRPPGVSPKPPEAPAAERVTPAFVTGVKRPPAPALAGERQTGGLGKVTTAAAAAKAYPPAVTIRYDARGRPTLSADEIPKWLVLSSQGPQIVTRLASMTHRR
jgi:hypothetical protein